MRLRSIDPADEDWADLEPLLDAIGQARIVLLGEASHGDGASFLAKGRLVRFLHRRAGFDVLVWESPFRASFLGGADAGDFPDAPSIEKGILPIWSGSRECAPTFDYIRATWATDRPIALVGLSQYVLPDDALFEDVADFFRKADPAWPSAAQRAALRDLKAQIAAQNKRPAIETEPPQEPSIRELIGLIAQDPDGKISAAHDQRETAVMRMALENMAAFAQSLYRPLSRGGADDSIWSEQEGRNLLFWAEHFAGRKLIVWAHNGHIIRNASGVEELGRSFGIRQLVTASDHARKSLGSNLYSIMFLAHGGKTGLWWDEPRGVPPPATDSLEAAFHDAGLDAAFVDLSRLTTEHVLRRRQVAAPIAYEPMRAVWPDCFDGIVFIDRMTPSTPR